jgi:hypothetical protein
VVDWANKVLFVLESKSTSDQKQDYRERGESRAKAQHDVLVKGLERERKLLLLPERQKMEMKVGRSSY